MDELTEQLREGSSQRLQNEGNISARRGALSAADADAPCVHGATLGRPEQFGVQGVGERLLRHTGWKENATTLFVLPFSTAARDVRRRMATAELRPERDPAVWVRQPDNKSLLTLSTVDFLISTRCSLLLLSFSPYIDQV